MRPSAFIPAEKRKEIACFTLLELLVAMTVLSLLMVMLFQVFNSATKAWAQAERKVDAFREARAALNVIAADLQSSVLTPNMQMTVSLPKASYLPSDARGSSLFFVTGASLRAQESTDLNSLCIAGYFCGYTSDNPGTGGLDRKSYKLYRYFLRSADTYNNLVANRMAGAPNLNPAISLNANPATCEVLGRNIYNFRVTYYTNSVGQTATASLTNDTLQVEIAMDGVNYDTAAKLSTETAWTNLTNSGSGATALSTQNIQTFRRRISLPKVPSDLPPQ
jgi:type II secretory pathway pseudopilin PulG